MNISWDISLKQSRLCGTEDFPFDDASVALITIKTSVGIYYPDRIILYIIFHTLHPSFPNFCYDGTEILTKHIVYLLE